MKTRHHSRYSCKVKMLKKQIAGMKERLERISKIAEKRAFNADGLCDEDFYYIGVFASTDKWYSELDRRRLLILIEAFEESRNRDREYAALNIKTLTKIICGFCGTILGDSCKECGIADIKKKYEGAEKCLKNPKKSK